jgi:hypothetical protein
MPSPGRSAVSAPFPTTWVGLSEPRPAMPVQRPKSNSRALRLTSCRGDRPRGWSLPSRKAGEYPAAPTDRRREPIGRMDWRLETPTRLHVYLYGSPVSLDPGDWPVTIWSATSATKSCIASHRRTNCITFRFRGLQLLFELPRFLFMQDQTLFYRVRRPPDRFPPTPLYRNHSPRLHTRAAI